MSRFRRSGAVLALTAAAAVAPLATPVPASAATANAGVYIVAPKWWGWCPNVSGVTNRVTFMSQVNQTTGNMSSDAGDDVIWSRVALNTYNTIDVQVGCIYGIGSSGTRVTIRPTRNGQTFWVSPTGASYGN